MIISISVLNEVRILKSLTLEYLSYALNLKYIKTLPLKPAKKE